MCFGSPSRWKVNLLLFFSSLAEGGNFFLNNFAESCCIHFPSTLKSATVPANENNPHKVQSSFKVANGLIIASPTTFLLSLLSGLEDQPDSSRVSVVLNHYILNHFLTIGFAELIGINKAFKKLVASPLSLRPFQRAFQEHQQALQRFTNSYFYAELIWWSQVEAGYCGVQ